MDKRTNLDSSNNNISFHSSVGKFSPFSVSSTRSKLSDSQPKSVEQLESDLSVMRQHVAELVDEVVYAEKEVGRLKSIPNTFYLILLGN